MNSEMPMINDTHRANFPQLDMPPRILVRPRPVKCPPARFTGDKHAPGGAPGSKLHPGHE